MNRSINIPCLLLLALVSFAPQATAAGVSVNALDYDGAAWSEVKASLPCGAWIEAGQACFGAQETAHSD